MKTITKKLALPVALIVGAVGTATAVDVLHDPIRDLDAQSAQEMEVHQAVNTDPENLAVAFRSASRMALPAVVNVEVEAAAQPRGASDRVPSPLEEFFRGPRQQRPQQPMRGSGSGFIISEDGYIITNNHVVENADRVTVELTDKREFDATVVGRDPDTDIAVLKVEGSDLPTVRLGNSDGLQIGDWVLALGYPLSLGETVTAGIVSAMGRSLGIMNGADGAVAPIEHFIQTDAAINRGNSGGPLINLRGEVIGVNTAIASQTGFYAGYGFAVPVTLAKRIADDLIQHGEVRRPRLGINIQDVSLADVEVFGLSQNWGVKVHALQDGPGADAGLQIGDVIVAVDGQPVRNTGELLETVALRQPGERVRIDYIRYGDERQTTVRLGQFESRTPAVSNAREAADDDAVGRLGFAAAEITDQIARQLQLSRAGGVVVTRVDEYSPAFAAGLRKGFVIEQMNGRDIGSIADLRAAAEGLGAGSVVSVVGRFSDAEGNWTRTIINYRIRG